MTREELGQLMNELWKLGWGSYPLQVMSAHWHKHHSNPQAAADAAGRRRVMLFVTTTKGGWTLFTVPIEVYHGQIALQRATYYTSSSRTALHAGDGDDRE